MNDTIRIFLSYTHISTIRLGMAVGTHTNTHISECIRLKIDTNN